MKDTLYQDTLNKLFLFVAYEMEENIIIKEIPNTDGRYFISNTGFVVSFCQNKPRILKPFIRGKGYLAVKINGKNKSIHQLVGQAFIDNPDNKPMIHHKNDNKKDNDINNLQWATAKENAEAYQKTKREKEKNNNGT